MARNRIIGRETQKMQEYTQEQINQAESRGIEISTDVKEQLFEYANLIGEKEKVRALVRNLADAVSQADSEGVAKVLTVTNEDVLPAYLQRVCGRSIKERRIAYS